MQARWRNASSNALVFHTILSDPNIVFAGKASKEHFCNPWKRSNSSPLWRSPWWDREIIGAVALWGGEQPGNGQAEGKECRVWEPAHPGWEWGVRCQLSARLGCSVVSGESCSRLKKCGNSLWTGVRPFPFTCTFLSFEEEVWKTEELEKRQYLGFQKNVTLFFHSFFT